MSSTVDKNWMSYVGDNPDVSGFYNPPNPEDYSDILKFGDATNVHVETKTVCPGQENCLDAVRGGNYLWEDCTFLDGSGVSTVTLKGSIDKFTFRDCSIGRGKNTDIELGQFDKYWYVGRPPTRNGLIDNCHSADGQPIRVTCWDAERPEAFFSNVSVTKVPWIVWFPYFCFRYVYIRLFPA